MLYHSLRGIFLNMCTCKEYLSTQNLHAVVVRSLADVCKVNNLVDELKHHGVDLEIIGAQSDVDLGAVLRHNGHRFIVYVSQQSVDDLCESKLSASVHSIGRDAVVGVLDDGLETTPGEWADFLCLRYSNQRLTELCRELALLIRTPLVPCRPLDINGYAIAFRNFNGFLRFALPNFHLRLRELYNADYALCVKKFLIICPASCCRPPSMEVKSRIEHTGKYVLRNITRAGQRHRDLVESLYRIRDEERDRDYYFSACFDNSLATLGDIKRSGLAGIDEQHMHEERSHYMLHRKQLLQNSKDHRKFTGQYRILYWRDREVDLYDFLLPVVREELESPPAEVFESPVDFPCVDGPGVNPGSLYANPEECYKLDREPRGICLIVNIVEFDSSTRLERRAGTEADERRLTDVFQWLKFKVQLYRNVNKSDFLRIIEETRELDHKEYDAFVCCVMSHGRLGRIYTADGHTLEIIEHIARAFYPKSCPTLAGKPKLFFIQACQTSDRYGAVTKEEFSAFETICSCASDADACASNDTRKRTWLTPEAPDFFMFYSTLPGNASFRDPQQKGTFYVQALTEVLKKGREL